MTDTTARNAALREMLSERWRRTQDDIRSRIQDGRFNRREEVRDDVDHSDASVQADIEVALLRMRTDTLTRIDEALARLDAGTYGFCFECAGLIADSRLRALPFAVRCRSCEAQREDADDAAQRLTPRAGASLLPDVLGV